MGRFLSELKRRNVIRVGIAYLTIAWLIIEVANTILPLFDVGAGVSRSIVILFAIGVLPVLLLAWTFEFTASGLKLDKDVDRSALTTIASTKRLDRLIIILLGVALVYFAFDKFVLSPGRESEHLEVVRQQAASDAIDTAKAAQRASSVAVLPFSNTSGDSTNDYLSDGLGDELRDSLAEVPGVLVVARSSSIRFRGQGMDAQAIAVQLGVGRVIEGRFNRQGNRFLVTVELIDATTGIAVWTQRYERASRDMLLLQQELARAVTRQLVSELLPAGEVPAPSAQQVSAHDLLLLGRQYEQQVTDRQVVDEEKLQKAIDYYRQAISVDPNSAEANARLGKMLLYLGDVDAAAGPIFNALRLDPQQSDANATQGLLYWLTRKPGTGAAYERAIDLNHNNAEAFGYYADWLWMQGDALGAENSFREAVRIDPLSLERQSKLGYKLAFAGKREEAEPIVRRIQELFPTEAGYLAAARISEAYGAPEDAIAYELKALALDPDNDDIAGQLAESLARIGDFESAAIFEPNPGIGLLFWSRRYDELIELGQELMIEYPDDDTMLFLLAFALNTQGRFDEALRVYEILGMPETVLSESRRPIELHHIMSLVGTLEGVGLSEQAAELSKWALDFSEQMVSGDGGSWASALSDACYWSVLDDTDAALARLETLPLLQPIIWLPFLKDLACLQNLTSEPRYQAVVRAIEERIAASRTNVHKTLQQQGFVLLDPAQK